MQHLGLAMLKAWFRGVLDIAIAIDLGMQLLLIDEITGKRRV